MIMRRESEENDNGEREEGRQRGPPYIPFSVGTNIGLSSLPEARLSIVSGNG